MEEQSSKLGQEADRKKSIAPKKTQDNPVPKMKLRASDRYAFRSILAVKQHMSYWKTTRHVAWNLKGLKAEFAKNTFQLHPTDPTRFQPDVVEPVANEVLERHLGPLNGYEAEKMPLLSKVIAEEIKEKVKRLGFTRYKLVSKVVIGQNLSQGVQVASRAMWDISNDNFVTVTYVTKELFAVATVFGAYYD